MSDAAPSTLLAALRSMAEQGLDPAEIAERLGLTTLSVRDLAATHKIPVPTRKKRPPARILPKKQEAVDRIKAGESVASVARSFGCKPCQVSLLVGGVEAHRARLPRGRKTGPIPDEVRIPVEAAASPQKTIRAVAVEVGLLGRIHLVRRAYQELGLPRATRAKGRSSGPTTEGQKRNRMPSVAVVTESLRRTRHVASTAAEFGVRIITIYKFLQRHGLKASEFTGRASRRKYPDPALLAADVAARGAYTVAKELDLIDTRRLMRLLRRHGVWPPPT